MDTLHASHRIVGAMSEPKRKALLYVDLRFQKLLATAESDWDKTEAAAEPIVRRLEDFIEADDSEEEE